MQQLSPRWLSKELFLAAHSQQLAWYGGIDGMNDDLLESALNRPQQKFYYAHTDIIECAAAYAFGIARNQPFKDGNKRTAYIACRTFLLDNGYDIQASKAEKYMAIMRLASGESDEEAFYGWLQEYTIELPA